MEVYRIEHHQTGKGICQIMGNDTCFVYRMAALLAGEPNENEQDRYPDYTEQCKAFAADTGDDKAHMRYAFPTLEALRKWFPGAKGRQAMVAVGARGAVYEVEELVATGPWQVIFDARRAKKIRDFDLAAA
jgi:hypothetical protein